MKDHQRTCQAIHTDAGGLYVYAQILWTLSITVRSSEIFKLQKSFRELYVILSVSIQDCVAFIVIYVYMIFQVTTMIRAKLIGVDPTVDERTEWSFNNHIGDVFAHTLGFGDSPIEELGKPGGIRAGEWIMFVFAMTIINILILNTLIAILGDR